MKARTGFDEFFDQQMQDPKFAAAYREARAEIDTTDALIRALDDARVAGGITKAELARRIGAKPEILRRLFTAENPNPTIHTVFKLVDALDFHLELVPNRSRVRRRRSSRSVEAREVRRR